MAGSSPPELSGTQVCESPRDGSARCEAAAPARSHRVDSSEIRPALYDSTPNPPTNPSHRSSPPPRQEVFTCQAIEVVAAVGKKGIGVEGASEVFCRFSSHAEAIKTRGDKTPRGLVQIKRKKNGEELRRGGKRTFLALDWIITVSRRF